MAKVSLITDELRSILGVEGEPEVYEVEKGHLKRFVQTIADPNPLWQDEEYSRTAGYGGIVAPPSYILTMGVIAYATNLLRLIPHVSPINAGGGIECYKPILAGDTITSVPKLTELNERQGRNGKLLFLVMEVTYKNQAGELVAKRRQEFIGR